MTEVQNRFVGFIKNREHIRLCKELVESAPPWTDDPILGTCRFCNVNREDDAVTRWIAANVRPTLVDISDAVTSLLACRVFNEPETLKHFRWPFDESQARDVVFRLRNEGQKLFRGAYMMPAHGSAGKGQATEDYWLNIIGRVSCRNFELCYNLESVADWLKEEKGLGDFLANQVCADLRHFRSDWLDWSTFVLCGPGSRRGLERWVGLEPTGNHGLDYPDLILQIRESLLTKVDETFNIYFLDPNNLSNCFCEFDKYERAFEQLQSGQRITLRKYGNHSS